MTFDAIKAHILRLEEEEGLNGLNGDPDDDEREGGQLSNVESLFAGSFAGFVSCTCTYPLDLARARLAVEPTRLGGNAAASAAEAGRAAAGGKGVQGARTAHSVLYIFQAAYAEGVGERASERVVVLYCIVSYCDLR